MDDRANVSLKSLNTFQVEAAAARYVRFETEAEILDFLGREPLEGQRHLVLGGGSNLLFVGDYAGMILHPFLKGIDLLKESRDRVWVRALAGESWDDLVASAVDNGWGGIENLSLIPGSVGASVVQNIGAYGVEVKDVIDRVEAICLRDKQKVTFLASDCNFGYRYSNFKGPWIGRYIVTSVVFRLRRQPRLVIDYPGVREALESAGPLTAATVRRAVIAIRERKLPDPATVGNAGSFFKNPLIDEKRLKDLLLRFPDMPHYSQAGGGFKVPAGWMIEHCGWKGRAMGRAAVHDKQALVLVNLGGATGQEILDLSLRVKQSVSETFGVDLEPEVVIVR